MITTGGRCSAQFDITTTMKIFIGYIPSYHIQEFWFDSRHQI